MGLEPAVRAGLGQKIFIHLCTLVLVLCRCWIAMRYSYLQNRRRFEISSMCAFVCSKQLDMVPAMSAPTPHYIRVPCNSS